MRRSSSPRADDVVTVKVPANKRETRVTVVTANLPGVFRFGRSARNEHQPRGKVTHSGATLTSRNPRRSTRKLVTNRGGKILGSTCKRREQSTFRLVTLSRGTALSGVRVMIGFQPATRHPTKIVSAAHTQRTRQLAKLLLTRRGLPIQIDQAEISRSTIEMQLTLELASFSQQTSAGVDVAPLFAQPNERCPILLASVPDHHRPRLTSRPRLPHSRRRIRDTGDKRNNIAAMITQLLIDPGRHAEHDHGCAHPHLPGGIADTNRCWRAFVDPRRDLGQHTGVPGGVDVAVISQQKPDSRIEPGLGVVPFPPPSSDNLLHPAQHPQSRGKLPR